MQLIFLGAIVGIGPYAQTRFSGAEKGFLTALPILGVIGLILLYLAMA